MVDRALAKGVATGAGGALPELGGHQRHHPAGRRPAPYRAELDLAPDAVVALYSGNMGNKQGLDILADVARLLQDEPHASSSCWVAMARDGPDLQARCAGLRNVRFLDLQPLERLNDWLGLADVHLLPQRADAADLVMPSKLTGMLASGRAVLATALPDTELCRVVVNTTPPAAWWCRRRTRSPWPTPCVRWHRTRPAAPRSAPTVAAMPKPR